MIPFVEKGDVVLVRSEWWSEPIHYYLPPDEYTVIAPPRHATDDELEVWRAGLPDRLWFVGLGGEEGAGAALDSLSSHFLPDHEPVTAVFGFEGEARLMVPRGTPDSGGF